MSIKLMAEVWTSGDITLYRADCRAVLPTLGKAQKDAPK